MSHPFTHKKPPFRKLRGYAFDPSLSLKIDTVDINDIVYKVPWEKLDPGPWSCFSPAMRNSEDPRLAAMATLDRHRIAKGWTSTMPNKYLLQELIRRTQGKLFIMDEFEVVGPPSAKLDPATLGEDVYLAYKDQSRTLYKQYTITGLR
ncbi:MAG: hypothetical protein BGO55_24960 [Sphingobacteriales bacterium 50-39]|nr:hypothetical protein [Sphingobacteriales bacterium]OJW58535.1 MAG: hypothetical protein BGO55_24960 [Sphingobacteriales bacterium 50-39]